jgi:hypothetical protein
MGRIKPTVQGEGHLSGTLSLGKRPLTCPTGIGAEDIQDNSIWRSYAWKPYFASSAARQTIEPALPAWQLGENCV